MPALFHSTYWQPLSEHGGGFSITASYGAILLPQESQDVTEAMRLVTLLRWPWTVGAVRLRP